MGLKEVINENNLILPNYSNLNIIDLMKVLYGRLGIEYKKNKNTKYLEDLIPNNNHVLFIISDGTGSNVINRLSDNSILKRNKKLDLLTVFPSTTACVLTSIVTAKFPLEQGIWGWFNYNRKLCKQYYPLLFKERKTLEDLKNQGVLMEDIFKDNSLLNFLEGKTSVLFPSHINDSVYSQFVIENNNRYSYNNFDDIEDYVKKIVFDNEKSYTYLYIPDVDTLEHKYGTDSSIVFDKLLEIEKLILKLMDCKDLTIVFTADHGQIDLKKRLIIDLKKYEKYFYALPTIDFCTASYYVKDEYKQKFLKEFNSDFKDEMFIFSTEEVLKSKIFGIGNVSDYAKGNLGEFISICKAGNYFLFDEKEEEFRGGHSGLTKEEMMVPLVIIDTNNKKIYD